MNNDVYTTNPKRPSVIDGVRPTGRSAATAALPLQKRRVFYYPSPNEQPKRGRLQVLQLPLLLLAGSCAGFFAETLAVGLAMLVIYATVALVTRIPSRTTFTLALLLLAAISVMLLVKPSFPLISNFSTYAFVLLAIGVVTLWRESKLPKRTRRKYRR